MSTVTAQAVHDKVVLILQDAGHDRWSSSEIVNWISLGQKQIILTRPDAGAVFRGLKLSAGTLQTLPIDAVMLLRATRNMYPDGLTPGTAVSIVSGEQLDAVSPDWHTEPRQAKVESIVYDPNSPLQFYCYPPNDGTGWIELVYAAVPPPLTLSSTLGVSDIYEGALVDYACYRTFSKDSEQAEMQTRAAAHYTAFNDAVGATAQSLGMTNPNRGNLPFDPGVQAQAK